MMKNLKPQDTSYMLERSLEELHKQSRQWVSEIDLWEKELKFFQKLLTKYTSVLTTREDKASIDKMQNLILYYDHDLLETFKTDIREHEAYLAKQLANEHHIEEGQYRHAHSQLESHISSFRAQFTMFKKEFYQLIEKALQPVDHDH